MNTRQQVTSYYYIPVMHTVCFNSSMDKFTLTIHNVDYDSVVCLLASNLRIFKTQMELQLSICN
jgi:hypothetical protein